MFQVVDVARWRLDEVDEQLGTKEKEWLLDPRDQRWLFKEVRSTSHGEDWAEKIVERLGLALGLPVATVELATRGDRRGIISRNFVPSGARLEHGNELLVRVDPDYDRDQSRRNERYTVHAVKRALDDAHAPDAYAIEKLSAFDLWAGYVVLDAWVGGRDRHHENWAVITDNERNRVLAPSFDHGNALGFQERPDHHGRLANHPDLLENWAKRGTSHHFAGRPALVDLAHAALDLASDRAGIWLTAVSQARPEEVRAVIEQVPSDRMSEPSRTFCQELLTLNQRRLCDVG